MLRKLILGLLVAGLIIGRPEQSEEQEFNIVIESKNVPNSSYGIPYSKGRVLIPEGAQLLDPGLFVLEASKDYIWASYNLGQEDYKKSLFKSSDLGESWQLAWQFSEDILSLHVTDEDIIFVGTSNDRWAEKGTGRIYRSEDGGESFIRVLDLESGAANYWNFASRANLIYISEYGYKDLPNNSRRIYRSEDRGQNWEVSYDPGPYEGYHNHVIGISKNSQDIAYQVIGDNIKKVLVSNDRGKNWSTLFKGYHPTSFLDLGDQILFGLDNYPKSGIIRYLKEGAKLDYAFETPEPYGGSNYDLLYEKGVIYAGFLSYNLENNPWDGSIFISRDKGRTWDLFFAWPKLGEDSSVGIYNFTSKDNFGFIRVELPMLEDGKLSYYLGSLKFPLLSPE